MGRIFTAFAKWLIKAFLFLVITLVNLLIDVVNALIKLIATIVSSIISAFPNTTLDLKPPPGLIEIASYVAWFIPLKTMAFCLGVIGTCFLVYFGVRPILKFLHVM